jgi:hypothetical protein
LVLLSSSAACPDTIQFRDLLPRERDRGLQGDS